MTHRTLAALMLTAGLAALAGCSSPSVITLNDGREIQTGRP
ncbi:MAG: YgdI/YgdR family lipoprotein, partial [Pseudomonas sp.]|nr:YgdI/YgdR family lipoprotein [Pseudomonas sp.]